jgi:hypothetical protein
MPNGSTLDQCWMLHGIRINNRQTNAKDLIESKSKVLLMQLLMIGWHVLHFVLIFSVNVSH